MPALDEDELRLPTGMRRVGYDANTQKYAFQDAEGGIWEGPPGSEYGKLTKSIITSPFRYWTTDRVNSMSSTVVPKTEIFAQPVLAASTPVSEPTTPKKRTPASQPSSPPANSPPNRTLSRSSTVIVRKPVGGSPGFERPTRQFTDFSQLESPKKPVRQATDPILLEKTGKRDGTDTLKNPLARIGVAIGRSLTRKRRATTITKRADPTSSQEDRRKSKDGSSPDGMWRRDTVS